jgi:hypothetical protein
MNTEYRGWTVEVQRSRYYHGKPSYIGYAFFPADGYAPNHRTLSWKRRYFDIETNPHGRPKAMAEIVELGGSGTRI